MADADLPPAKSSPPFSSPSNPTLAVFDAIDTSIASGIFTEKTEHHTLPY